MARGDGLFRQWELLKVLQAHRFGVSMDELCARLECDKRTVQRDLKALQDIFPISHERRGKGKRYWKLARNFMESDQLQLTMTEMLSLYLSQQLLLPLAGTQFGDGLRTTIKKVRALLSTEALGYFEGLDQSIFIKSIASQDYSQHDKHIRLINQAIADRTILSLTYQSASRGRQTTSDLHPYGVILFQSSLYCIGYLACHGEIRTLKISRMRGLGQTSRSFNRPSDFSLAAYSQGAFGIFHGKSRVEVRVRLSGWAATNVREMQWHGSQRVLRDDGDTAVVSFTLGNTVEFKRWVLGFGQHARVLAPVSLAEEIGRELSLAVQQYGTDRDGGQRPDRPRRRVRSAALA